jgi:hypothetical protein
MPGRSGPVSVPAFLREHTFALSSTLSSPAVHRAHAHASAALASLSAHGSAVALAVALLQAVLAAAPPAPAPPMLPDLQRALVAVLEAGTARNSDGRAALRACVARVVFADASSPHLYRAAIEALAALAADRTIRDEAWRLRSLAKAARDVLRDLRAAHEEAPLASRVWKDTDMALAHAIGNRDDYRGGEIDAVCARLISTAEALVVSAQVGTFPATTHLKGPDSFEVHPLTFCTIHAFSKSLKRIHYHQRAILHQSAPLNKYGAEVALVQRFAYGGAQLVHQISSWRRSSRTSATRRLCLWPACIWFLTTPPAIWSQFSLTCLTCSAQRVSAQYPDRHLLPIRPQLPLKMDCWQRPGDCRLYGMCIPWWTEDNI